MNEQLRCAIRSFLLVAMLFSTAAPLKAAGSDPWRDLRRYYEHSKQHPDGVGGNAREEKDPWVRLRAVFLPFSQGEEDAALFDSRMGRKVSASLRRIVRPYMGHILSAAARFDIPPEIIAAVIMVESGGNPLAKAELSSAAGLMQTVRATFNDARQSLYREGILLPDAPFDQRASIMAGSWYLDRMFETAARDYGRTADRGVLKSWRKALEYYYAGPGNGRKAPEIVIVYINGKRIIIDKPSYAAKVLRWAAIMHDDSG